MDKAFKPDEATERARFTEVEANDLQAVLRGMWAVGAPLNELAMQTASRADKRACEAGGSGRCTPPAAAGSRIP